MCRYELEFVYDLSQTRVIGPIAPLQVGIAGSLGILPETTLIEGPVAWSNLWHALILTFWPFIWFWVVCCRLRPGPSFAPGHLASLQHCGQRGPVDGMREDCKGQSVRLRLQTFADISECLWLEHSWTSDHKYTMHSTATGRFCFR